MNGISAEWVSAIASVMALLVVAIGSFAALRQIAHFRQGLRIEVAMRLFEQYQTKRIRRARVFVRSGLDAALADEAVRGELLSGNAPPPVDCIVPLANFFENLGQLIGTGYVNEAVVLDAFPVLEMWERLAPMIALIRVRRPDAFEMFEYLAMLETERNAARGTVSSYPAGARRMPLPAIDGPG